MPETQYSPIPDNACKSCDGKCCRGLAVVLTIPEARRLVGGTGKKPEEILEFNSNIDSKQTPHYPLLVSEKGSIVEYFIIIKRGEGKQCMFLDGNGRCGIYKIRPHVCRLYPFELDGGKQKKNVLCPKMFGKTPEIVESAKELSRELHEHGVIARGWISKFGKEPPKIENFWDELGD